MAVQASPNDVRRSATLRSADQTIAERAIPNDGYERNADSEEIK